MGGCERRDAVKLERFLKKPDRFVAYLGGNAQARDEVPKVAPRFGTGPRPAAESTVLESLNWESLISAIIEYCSDHVQALSERGWHWFASFLNESAGPLRETTRKSVEV